MATVDWNMVLFMLDTLSEGGYSYAEYADFITRHCGSDTMQKCLWTMRERGLIDFFTHEDGATILSSRDWRDNVSDFFDAAQRDRESCASHFIELSERGQQVVNLLGIGVGQRNVR